MKKPLRIIIVLSIIVLAVVGNVVRRHATVSGVEVRIDYNGADTLVTAKTVEDYMAQRMPKLRSMLVKEVDKRALERLVSSSDYLLSCDVWVSMAGKVVVEAVQRCPIVRVFYGDKEFYIDETGAVVPLSGEGDCNVLVASGIFRQTLPADVSAIRLNEWAQDSVRMRYDLTKVWLLADYLWRDEVERDCYDQIYLDAKGDMHLTPRSENYDINLGSAASLDEKFRHIETFRAKVVPVKGNDAYSQLILKYKGQIVCRKREQNN